MLSKVFKVVEPRRFDLYIEDVQLQESEALVQVDYVAICKADLRYYEGSREERLLAFKYPMSLIHEATGVILNDPSQTFQKGDRVVLIPNRVDDTLSRCEDCVCNLTQLGENYCPQATFASSSHDGFSKEVLAYPVKSLLKIPEELQSNEAVFLEMLSVAMATIRRVEIPQNGSIAIWGDGILGFLLSVVLSYKYPNRKLIAVGKHKEKLIQFPVGQTYLVDEVPKNLALSIAFECVGGQGAAIAINEILEKISTGGKVVLTGVTENAAAITTRPILEKGLSIYGVTRSQRKDFEQALDVLQDTKVKNLVRALILSESQVNSINDYYRIFEKESNNRELGKHIMQFNI